MSFSEYYKKNGLNYKTNLIDTCISDVEDQNDYYSVWITKYKEKLNKCSPDYIAEWVIKTNKSEWSMMSASTILVEAECSLNNQCFVSFYFSLYYALFHAVYSLLYMDPGVELDALFRISHSKLLKLFSENYTGKHGMFNDSAIELFEELKYKREYYSYNAPLNMVFDKINNDFHRTKDLISKIIQTLFFHSFIAHQAVDIMVPGAVSLTSSPADGHARKFCKITDLNDRIGFHEKFYKFYSNIDVILLKDERNKLRKRKKNVKATISRNTEKKSSLLKNKKFWNENDKQKLQIVCSKLSAAQIELGDIEKKLVCIDKTLSQVKLDPSADSLLLEFESGRAGLGIEQFQLEVDHLFDELRGYAISGLGANSPIKLDVLRVWKHVYSCL